MMERVASKALSGEVFSALMSGVFCLELREAYFGRTDGDRQIVAFADLGERTLKAIAQKSSQAPELLADKV